MQGQRLDTGNLHAREQPCPPRFGARSNAGAIKLQAKHKRAEGQANSVLLVPGRLRGIRVRKCVGWSCEAVRCRGL